MIGYGLFALALYLVRHLAGIHQCLNTTLYRLGALGNLTDNLHVAGCQLLAFLATKDVNHSSAQPTAGTGYELDAIAAVVLGGTSLAGGKGRIVGTLIGALILGFLNNGLNLLGVSSYYQMIVKAVVILLAVLVDNKKQ